MENLIEWSSKEAVVIPLIIVLLGVITATLQKYLSGERELRSEIDRLAELAATRKAELQLQVMQDGIREGNSEPSRAERKETALELIRNLSPSLLGTDESDLVEDLVNEYHKQALSQARVQFWFSVMAASLGFLYIIYSANGSSGLELIKTFPGIIIEAVAALFFKQAEQTRTRATELYDRLRNDRQIDKAATMVQSIEDPKIRSAVKAQLTLHMAGMTPKEIDLQTFVTKELVTSEHKSEKDVSDS